MREQIDVLKILKNHSDLVNNSFYSPIFGWCKLDKLTNDRIYVSIPDVEKTHYFDRYGRYSSMGEMMLFVNEDCVEYDWLSYKFLEGDFIIDNGTVCIFKQINPDRRGYSVFAGIDCEDNLHCYTEEWGTLNYLLEARLASKEEADILLDRLYKERRYHWDEELHLLYSVFAPGDIVKAKFFNKGIGIVSKQHEDTSIEFSFYFEREIGGTLFKRFEFYVPTEKSADFRLATEAEIGEFMKDKKEFEKKCLSNKFDPTTLKHFDKVLVRSHNSDVWECDFFSSYNPNCSNPFHCLSMWTEQCIPYNDITKHLAGTINEPDNYFVTWEKQ
jgi:hypothetical protein